MMPQEPTPAAIRILEALVEYQYLNNSLVEMLGIATKRTARDKLFPTLLGRGLVACRKFGFVHGRGSIEHLYGLTAAGARFVAEMWGDDSDSIPVPRDLQIVRQDHDHRLALIMVHIRLAQWIEQIDGQLIAFDRYFGRVPNPEPHRRSLVSATTIFHRDGKLTPDAIAKFEAGGSTRLVAIEIHHNERTGRIIEQLEGYLPAIREHAFNVRYQHLTPPFVLSVFDKLGALKATKARFLAHPELSKIKGGFLFSSLAAVRDGIAGGWHYADDAPAPMFKAAADAA
ncbi:MAG: hypothetical protein H7Y60_02555 [Rhodospirillaceae bacterium]|nr:hypothetical protein [Rhodospirillales bacterium]